MAICPKCGATVEDGTRFCVTCGAALGAPAAPTAPQPEFQQPQNDYQQPQQQYQQPQYQQPQYQQQPPAYAPPPVMMDQDTKDNRVLALFCYLAVILPLVAQPNSAFIRYHANQGIVLILFSLCATVVNIIPILGWIVSGICYIFAFICTIIGIVHACKGEKKPLPLIGKYTILH